MNYIEQEILVRGAGDDSPGIGVGLSGALFREIERTVQPCVRMALTGRSLSVGKPPRWLDAACDVRALAFSKRDGDIIMHLSTPRLGDAAPKVFEQQTLWDEGIKPDETAIELMGKLIQDVRTQVSNSDTYDGPMLTRLARWHGLLETKVKSVILPGYGRGKSEVLDESVVVSARTLNNKIPAARQVRLVGKVDMVRSSTRSMGLRLDGGDEIRCAVLDDVLDFKSYLDREITVLGKAVYRPSGSVQRVDVEAILDTTVGREQFSSLPVSLDAVVRPHRKMQNARMGVAAIFGTWPGDETDAELLSALAALER